MAWCYLTDEQIEILNRVHDAHYTEFSDGDCPTCPIKYACDRPREEFPDDQHEYTRMFELGLYKAAKKELEKTITAEA